LLGHFGAALEWSQVGDCRNHAGMGEKHDLERALVNLSKTVYQKGISLSKGTMQAIEDRLERNPILPKWDILIRPG
jgi:undecaprenyl pyrophosphate synthase